MSLFPNGVDCRRVVADFERSLSPEGRQQLGHFAIEGFRLVERALSAQIGLGHAIICKSDFDRPCGRMQGILDQLKAHECEVSCVSDEIMSRLTEGRTLGSILALAKLPQVLRLKSLLESWNHGPAHRKILVLDQIMDPGNVGALLRTSHALGVEALVTIGGTDPFHPRSARTSMGSIFRVPIIRYDSADKLISLLREQKVCTIGASTLAGTPIHQAAFENKRMALFVGNEGKGLDPDLSSKLDQLVSIPMSSAIDSLSVNAATAVILYAMSHNSGN